MDKVFTRASLEISVWSNFNPKRKKKRKIIIIHKHGIDVVFDAYRLLEHEDPPKETVILTLSNKTLLPARWQADLREFADVSAWFSLSHVEGVVSPKSDSYVVASFEPPPDCCITLTGRTIRIEVTLYFLH